MKLIWFLLVCLTPIVTARPQYSYPNPTTTERSGYPVPPPPSYLPPCTAAGGRPVVQCQRRQTSPGVWDFTCEGVDMCAITIQREDILWLKSEGRDETINVVVPNYKLEEVIKAAFKTAAGGKTGVNILLKRPRITADAEVDERQAPRGEPEVQIEYEPVPPREIVHYPVDKQYRQLTGPILEP